MGAPGSSRWLNHVKKPLVEQAMRIDLRHPKLKGLLASDRADGGTLYWSDPRTGSPMGWADFRLSPLDPDGTRNLVLGRTGDDYEPKQCVSLGLRSAGFSTQWFAGCRGCDSWVRTLYAMSQGDRFRCRICSNLTYASVQKHDSRMDLARRDPEGFIQSRARAPQTARSQSVTSFLALEALDPCRPGRGWGRKSITTFDRVQAKLQREWEDRWGRAFPTVANPLPITGIDE